MPELSQKRCRLAKILGMLGSAHDGEVLAAARAAQEALGEIGMTWEELIAGDTDSSHRPPNGHQTHRARQPANWQAFALRLVTTHTNELTEWEYGFTNSFIVKGWARPTTKQKAVFERIASKIGIETPG